MSPTVFREGGLRFYFFSREEPRMHIHVQGTGGEAKVWLEPSIELADNYGLSRRALAAALRLIRSAKMKSMRHGKRTSGVEITNVSRNGFWLLVGERELFLPFKVFPWFRQAPIRHLLKVQLLHPDHLYWPNLDVDLHVDSIEHPEGYPLVSKARPDNALHGRRGWPRVARRVR